MTEFPAPDDHLGLDRLADLEEGLLTPAEEQAARDHLAGCAVCQADVAALAAVRAALLDDAEIAMPADIADRLYSALADQPALAPARAAVTTLPTWSGPSAWERRRKPVLITLAAAAAVALLTVGVIHLPRSESSSASSAASTSSAPAASPEILHSGHNYTAAGLGPDGAALVGGAAAGVTSAGAAAATSGAAAAATSAAAAAAATSAAAAATAAAAGTQAAATSGAAAAPTSAAAASAAAAPAKPPANAGASSAAATSSTAAAPSPPAPAATTDALGALRAPDAAQRCIALLLQSTVTPLVIDFATFDGKPAVIGVVPDPQDPTRLAVIAVGPPACSLYSLNYVPKP